MYQLKLLKRGLGDAQSSLNIESPIKRNTLLARNLKFAPPAPNMHSSEKYHLPEPSDIVPINAVPVWRCQSPSRRSVGVAAEV